MTMQFSYWEHESWLKPPDLLIVGAGIVGCSAALFYKEKHPDAEILLVDKGMMPEGASTRNAGFACIGSMSEHLSDIETAGLETVLGRIKRRWNGLNLLRQTLGEESIGYEHTGGYEIFTDDELYQSCVAKMEEMNGHMEEITGQKGVYSTKMYEGYPAIFNHVEGALNSGMLMRTLHRRLATAGVRVWWNTAVRSVDPGITELENGLQLKPKNTLLATNGFTSRLREEGIKPARGYVFITEPIAGLPWRGTFNHNKGFVYFRNVGDRLLIGGARDIAKEEEFTDEFGVNPKIKEYLIRFVNETLKLPSGWKTELEWSGIMGFTENKEPVIRQSAPTLYTAAGLSGMGIAIGMEVGKAVVGEILNDK